MYISTYIHINRSKDRVAHQRALLSGNASAADAG